MSRQRTRQRAILIAVASALMLGAGLAAANASDARGDLGAVGSRTTATATAAAPSSAPVTTAPTATPPAPTGGPDECTDRCSCAADATTTPLPELAGAASLIGAATRLHAGAPAPATDEPRTVKIKFHMETDGEKKIKDFDPTKHVTIDNADFRDYVTGEAAINDPMGCYKVSFDSSRFDACRVHEVLMRVGGDLTNVVEAAPPEAVEKTAPDGSKYYRWFTTIGPKRANAVIEIWIECRLK